MTAQVAVMNLIGVAVASDTVTTSNTTNGSKTVGSAEKIYELGPQHKVLVLHSNSVDISGVPHQLHIAEWAKSLAAPLPTVQAYIDNYIEWSSRENGMVDDDSERRTVHYQLNDHYYYIKNRIDSEANEFQSEAFPGDAAEFIRHRSSQIDEIVQDASRHLDSLVDYEHLSEIDAKICLNRLEINVEEKIDYIFKDIPLTDPQRQVLMESAGKIICKAQPMDDLDSDLGFVGFGEDEPFATVKRLKCRGIYGGRLQAYVRSTSTVKPVGMRALVSYFAQYDAMWGFVNGATISSMNKIREEISARVEERWGDTTPDPIGWEIAEEVSSAFDAWAQERYIDPLLDTIDAMGTIGLANMADSLVSLQATASSSQDAMATVGGLIEVATIDKINGIQWVRRLNHGFI